jgi:hypothetical protein
MEELLVTLDAVRKKDMQDKKFLAAIQGVDLDEEAQEEEDITKIKGYRAQQDGFGIGIGLGHVVEDNAS